MYKINKILQICAGLCFILIAVVPLAVADEPLTIIITGTHLPVEQTQYGGSIFTIEKPQIAELNPRSVSQLLQLVPGLYIENASVKGNINTVYLRGAEPNYVLVIIDGVKVNDPSNSRGGAFDFSMLDVNSIQRIEVVKGAYSSVYGSDAMAGVINIITNKTKSISDSMLRVEAGSQQMGNMFVSTERVGHQGSLSFNAAYNDDGEPIKDSQFIGHSFNMKGEYQWDASTHYLLNANYQAADSKTFPEDSGGNDYAVIRELDKLNSQLQRYTFQFDRHLHNDNKLSASYGLVRNIEEFASPGIDSAIPVYNTDTDYKRHQFVLDYSVSKGDGPDFSIGMELEREDAISSGVVDPAGFNLATDFTLDRNLYAMFGEVRSNIAANLNINAGIRWDAPQDFANRLSPRLSMRYLNNNTTFQASWSEGYKLPSFFALAHPIVGNPDFKPESSESYELGCRHDFSNITSATVTLFRQTYYDLIDFDSGMLIQRNEVITKGIEIGAVQRLSNVVSVTANYSFSNFSIKGTDADLLKRPQKTGSVLVSWNMSPPAVLSVQGSYIGPIKDYSYPTGQRTLDSYYKIDTSINWQWNTNWNLQFAIDNLTDQHYQQSIGNTAPEAGIRLALMGNV